jgi:hypothetical protein
MAVQTESEDEEGEKIVTTSLESTFFESRSAVKEAEKVG